MRQQPLSGYLSVGINGSQKTVHRLVALAFLGSPPSAAHGVNHKDGNKTNNRIDNLEWMTQKQNLRHAVEVLGLMRGTHKNAKVTPERVIQIREMRTRGVSVRDVADAHGISKQLVSAIIAGREWAWVKSDHTICVQKRRRVQSP